MAGVEQLGVSSERARSRRRRRERPGGRLSTVSSAPPGGATNKIPSPPLFFPHPTGWIFKHLQTGIIPPFHGVSDAKPGVLLH